MKNAHIEWFKSWQDEKPEIVCPECSYTSYIDNQIVEVVFQSDEPWSSQIKHWNIGLIIHDKDQSEEVIQRLYDSAAITGRIGMRGLLFAKEAILDFEEKLKNSSRHNGCEEYLYVTWLENRRRRVYEFALKKMGFILSQHSDRECLIKEI